MANTKISALTVATTPLAGTEVLPIVQSGVTKQVSVANLTAGRAVSADSLTLTGSPLPATSGGTGQSSYAVGDLLYASTTTALSKLADVATGNALISGGVGVAPSWGKVGLTTHVSGVLPSANGGTNTSTVFTAGSVVFAGGGGGYNQDNANFFWDDANNRLGIGSNAPKAPLDVKLAAGRWMTTKYDTNVTLSAENDSGNPENMRIYGENIRLYTPQGGFAAANLTLGAELFSTTGNFQLYTGNLVIGTSGKGITTGSSIPLGLGTNNGVSSATVHASGGVSIGNTTDPGAKNLSVSGNIEQITTGQVVHTVKSSSTSGTRDAIVRLSVASNGGNDAAGTILFTYDTAYTQAAKIDSLLTAGGGAGILRFFTSTSEAFRLNDTQQMLVGYTASNGGYKLQVNSQIFATNATIATSDGNYKTNVTPLNDALSLVCKLNPVSFKWKQHPVHNFDCETPTIGFIAQEVKETLKSTGYVDSIVKRNECVIEPEVVENGVIVKEAIKEEFLGLADATLVALLTKAIQELKAEFDAYRSTHP